MHLVHLGLDGSLLSENLMEVQRTFFFSNKWEYHYKKNIKMPKNAEKKHKDANTKNIKMPNKKEHKDGKKELLRNLTKQCTFTNIAIELIKAIQLY